MVDDLADLGAEDMLQYDPYQDESQNVDTFPSLDEEPEIAHEWGYQYVNVEILLQRGDKVARDQVLS